MGHLAETLRGPVAVAATPFSSDGEVDLPGHQAVLENMLDGGVTTIVVNGNTSEFYALSREEAELCTVTVAKVVGATASVLVGVGLDTKTAVHDALTARRVGAAGVMVHQPPHPYRSAEGWVQYHRSIAQSVPELPIVLYIRDSQLPPQAIADLAESCENVFAVKYAVRDLGALVCAMRLLGDRLVWLSGLAEVFAPGYYAYGAVGFTSGLANVAPRLSVELHNQLASADLRGARSTLRILAPFEEMRSASGSSDNVSVVKAALSERGVCGPMVRPPSAPLRPEKVELVRRIMTDWAAKGLL